MKLNFLKNKKGGNKGYTLVEILFYVSILAILSLLIINSLLVMIKSFRETNISNSLRESSVVMDRIVRETRKAVSINTISSSDLKLNTTDDAGDSKTMEFLFSGTNIQLLENDILTGNLNSPQIGVLALTFTEISTASGKGVKIYLSVKSNDDTLNRSVGFYDTVVLRGSY